MNVIMTRPSSTSAYHARRSFFMGSQVKNFSRDTIDSDFDNDNEKPLSADHLDWHLTRRPRLATD
ncbi:hypothetical protein [Sphingomonas jaspsi]|uniref:hypothetical protein n=1 Tax=Sphingomonas jaspsi TaxID=392409 RepID=UPI0004AD0E98|nr:hypothetical protein [Sphingomonas jaspsi]